MADVACAPAAASPHAATLPLAAIGNVIRSVTEAGEYQGDSGNCARFAVVLNRVLGAGGEYVIVTGQHYEYANHVAVAFRGGVFDVNGLTTEDRLLAIWGDESSDDSDDESDEDASEVEAFPDPSDEGDMVSRLADTNGIFAVRLDEDQFERDLRQALARAVRSD